MRPQPKGAADPLRALREEGQALWLDHLSRRFVAEGELARRVEEDGVSGVTSNPTIFEKAIAGSADYDASLREAPRDLDAKALYERLAIEDIRGAADVLQPVHEATDGRDGYASLEVSPHLAADTQATLAEARRLSAAVGRDNVMIKVPATRAGLPAIRELTAEGVKVNITLVFSQAIYEEVVEAYLSGLERLVAAGGEARRVASVASFFVSRIDAAVDRIVEDRIARGTGGAERDALAALRGKVAIANAKLAYRRFQRRFAGPRWARLAAQGARVQRLLWASTGTKNPAYSDVLYVEQLIGADTVNTMPPATLDAFRDHGEARATLERQIGEAERTMATLDRLGISIDAVGAELTEDGVRRFVKDFDKLVDALERKRAR